MQDALFAVEAAPVQSRVYLIGVAESPVVKIGKAVNVEQRRKSLQTSSPHKLVTRWATPGGHTLERWLHAEFDEFRVEGEWFDFGDRDPVAEVKAAVRRFGLPAAEVNAVQLPDIYELRVMLGPKWDIRWPRPDDPDCGHPDYQPDTCGCRSLTPTEIAVEVRRSYKVLSSYYYTGRPLPGGERCLGYNH